VQVNVPPKLTADAIIPKSVKGLRHAAVPFAGRREGCPALIAIGASTGGTEALETLLVGLSSEAPGIVIVQHMPEGFTAAFSSRLNGLCEIEVREAKNGDAIGPGLALIAPGNWHLLVRSRANGYCVEVKSGPPVCRHRPSVDVLFRSVAQTVGHEAVGVILTGMGDDGAQGMLEMKQAGAFTIAQDRESCVVFGMPNEAVKRGGVDRVASLDAIAPLLMSLSTGGVRRLAGSRG
jgi:two-component system chemotaxis response regulator CheB